MALFMIVSPYRFYFQATIAGFARIVFALAQRRGCIMENGKRGRTVYFSEQQGTA
jgi:hypothetical protein